jgi:uncharacterized protein (DUF1330 family)
MKTFVVVVDTEITDAEGLASLSDGIAAEVTGHGGRYLNRSGAVSVLGGDLAAEEITIIEFDSPEHIKALFESPKFIELRERRRRFVRATAFVVEGA